MATSKKLISVVRALLIGIVCVPCIASAQVIIEGYALSYPAKLKGVPGVLITESTQGCMTDNNGYFKVQFPGETDRGQCSLKIEPPSSGEFRNYIVMEVDGLHYVNTASITIGRREPIKIGLCSPEVFENIVSKLIKPYLNRALAEKDKRIADLLESNERLKLSNEQLRKKLQFIENQYQLSLNNYRELAEKFARINPEFADDNLKRARNYFEQGDIESAKKCLPGIELLQKNIESEKTATSLRLSIIKTENNIAEACQIYDFLLSITGRNNEKFDLLVDYSEYLLYNAIFDSVLVDSALSLAKEANSLYQLPLSKKIYSYNLLGKIQKGLKNNNYFINYKTAINLFNEARDDIKAKRNVAISHNEYASYRKGKGVTNAAIVHYQKALDLYIDLYNKDEYDNPNYLNTLINLAACYAEKRNKALVGQCLQRIKLLSNGKSMTVADSIRIYTALGTFHLTNNEYNDALSCYKLAHQICMNQEKKTPLYRNKTIQTEFLIGLTYNYMGEYQECLQYCKSAEEHITFDLLSYQLDLGYIYALKSSTYKHLQNIAMSRNFLEKSVDINKIIKDKDLADFLRYVKHENLYSYIGGKRFSIQSYPWIILMCIGSFTMLV